MYAKILKFNSKPDTITDEEKAALYGTPVKTNKLELAKILKYNPNHDKLGKFAKSNTLKTRNLDLGLLDDSKGSDKSSQATNPKQGSVAVGIDFKTATVEQMSKVFSELGVIFKTDTKCIDLTKDTKAVEIMRSLLGESAVAFKYMKDELGFQLGDYKIGFYASVRNSILLDSNNDEDIAGEVKGNNNIAATVQGRNRGEGDIYIGGAAMRNKTLRNPKCGPPGSWTLDRKDWPSGVATMVHEVGHVMSVSGINSSKLANDALALLYKESIEAGNGVFMTSWPHVEKNLSKYGSYNVNEFLAELNVLHYAYPNKVPGSWKPLGDEMKTTKKTTKKDKGYTAVLKKAKKVDLHATEADIKDMAKVFGMTVEEVIANGII